MSQESKLLSDLIAAKLRALGTVLSICAGTALVSPMVGSVADRYGPLVVLRFCITTGAGSFLMLFFCQFISNTKMRLAYACVVQFISCGCFRSLSAVLNAYTISWIKKNRPEVDSADVYGSYRLYGAVSWGLVSMCLGFLMDLTGTTKVMFVSMVVFASLFLIALRGEAEEDMAAPVPDEEGSGVNKKDGLNVFRDVVELFRRYQGSRCLLGTFFVLMFALAAGMSLVENLLFLYFAEDLKTSYSVMGLSVVVTVSFEIPLFALSGIMLRRLGEVRMILIGVACYSIRVFAYTMIDDSNKLLVLLFEPMHGITVACAYSARVIYVSKALATENSQALAQSTITVITALGMMVGTFTGGFMEQFLGSGFMYRFYATLVAMCALVYYFASCSNGLAGGVQASTSAKYLKVKHSDAIHDEEEDAGVELKEVERG